MAEIPEWRRRALRQMNILLVVLFLVLSAIFLGISFLTGSLYIRGVGIGLVIAWVTLAVAVLAQRFARVES